MDYETVIPLEASMSDVYKSVLETTVSDVTSYQARNFDNALFGTLEEKVAEDYFSKDIAKEIYEEVMACAGLTPRNTFTTKFNVSVLVDGTKMFTVEVEAEDEDAAEEEVSSMLEWDVNISGTVSYSDESGDFNRVDVNTPNDITDYLIVEYQVEEV